MVKIKSPKAFTGNELRKNLKTKYFGRKDFFLPKVDSTNDTAKKMAREGIEEGTLIVSEIQEKGRGRTDREWISPIGGIWCSLVLRPDISPEQAPQITLVAGIAIANVIHRLYNLDARIKWPNDVLIGKRKFCGILTEMEARMDRVTFVVMGIGLNANVDIDGFPEEIKEGSTSLERELGRKVNRAELLSEILNELEKHYDVFVKNGFKEFASTWQDMSSTIGKKVRIVQKDGKIEGEAIKITGEGALMIKKEDGSIEMVIAGGCLHLE